MESQVAEIYVSPKDNETFKSWEVIIDRRAISDKITLTAKPNGGYFE